MKIQAIEVYHVAMPIIYPFRVSFGDIAHIESILVRMVSEKQHGWSESCPLGAPAYSSEWTHGVFIMVRDWLAPLLVGKEVTSGEQLQRALSGVKGNYFAKAALDLAWWDLHARGMGKPLWQVIGGKGATVDVGADIGVMESLDALLAEIAKAKEAGFKRLKLKYRPGWELNMISAVREAYPDMVIHVDCNSAYTLADLPMFQELDRYHLAMIEQPLQHDDLLDHARLQASLRTPVCLDESIVSVDKARKAMALKACRWVNIKLGRVGGLTNALAIHDLCQEAGIPCWVGGMLESAVGQAHSIALATLPNIKYPSDIFPTSRFYHEDLGVPAITLSGPSQVTATTEPGIGCEPDARRLEERLVEKAIVE
ncbi:MAG: o-succinylbenzoate synthase [Anaerolineae bacterium]|nr:o-succinylbenzoate synthase [Anaerolineae bacterium]